MSLALLALAACAALLPDTLTTLIGGTASAWAYVCYGTEAAVLWLLLASRIDASTQIEAFAARAVCAWGAFEAAERPIFRLAFPMDHPPKLPPGQGLADAATGLPMSLVSVALALLLACMVQEARRVRY